MTSKTNWRRNRWTLPHKFGWSFFPMPINPTSFCLRHRLDDRLWRHQTRRESVIDAHHTLDDGLGVWQAKCKQVSFRLSWTPRPSTCVRGDFLSIPDAQPFSVSLRTVVCACCVCPKSKPHVLDGKVVDCPPSRLPAFILVCSVLPVMDFGSTF